MRRQRPAGGRLPHAPPAPSPLAGDPSTPRHPAMCAESVWVGGVCVCVRVGAGGRIGKRTARGRQGTPPWARRTPRSRPGSGAAGAYPGPAEKRPLPAACWGWALDAPCPAETRKRGRTSGEDREAQARSGATSVGKARGQGSKAGEPGGVTCCLLELNSGWPLPTKLRNCCGRTLLPSSSFSCRAGHTLVHFWRRVGVRSAEMRAGGGCGGRRPCSRARVRQLLWTLLCGVERGHCGAPRRRLARLCQRLIGRHHLCLVVHLLGPAGVGGGARPARQQRHSDLRAGEGQWQRECEG